ncbi:MAG: hypothetical protein AAGG08_09670, partial [Actinomycetota bacterium]
MRKRRLPMRNVTAGRRSRHADERGLRVIDDRLHLGRIDLLDVARRHGSPVHVVDGAALDRAAAEATRAGTHSTVYASYKTNPVPAVLSRLHAGGVLAEVISPYEWWLARRLGVDGSDLIYNGPAKSVESLRHAVVAGAELVNANSADDLSRIADAAADAGRRVRAGVRISLPHMWGAQFGLAAPSAELTATIRRGLGDPNLDL